MPSYPVLCTLRNCGRPAVYKIAARWSDGNTHELKTYALTCAECLDAAFRASQLKRSACRLAPGERLEEPGIYALRRGASDSELERRPDMEQQIMSAEAARSNKI